MGADTPRAVDRRHMSRALDLARRGLYTTDPNPRVGCVIAHGERIVGEGWHRYPGEPHAEIHALAAAGADAAGATAYVTLEPCRHTGRTGPCTRPSSMRGSERWSRRCAIRIRRSRARDSPSSPRPGSRSRRGCSSRRRERCSAASSPASNAADRGSAASSPRPWTDAPPPQRARAGGSPAKRRAPTCTGCARRRERC